MRDDLQRWLDGELPDEALSGEELERGRRLRALLTPPREVGPAPD